MIKRILVILFAISILSFIVKTNAFQGFMQMLHINQITINNIKNIF